MGKAPADGCPRISPVYSQRERGLHSVLYVRIVLYTAGGDAHSVRQGELRGVVMGVVMGVVRGVVRGVVKDFIVYSTCGSFFIPLAVMLIVYAKVS